MSNIKIGVLGSGIVGEVLANGFLKAGYPVMRGSRNPHKMESWKEENGTAASIGTFEQTAIYGDLIIIAVKGTAAESAINLCKPDNLAQKTVIDTTNPIADSPPENGVLRFFTDYNQSLMERLQTQAPKANFVKAFSCVGNSFMVNPNFPGGRPTMFICGNNNQAKNNVREILSQFGWETEDMGAVESARAIEPLCMLWCIPGLSRNQWNHAFKLLKTKEGPL